MKDRIIKFLSENNLTSTKFADKIGVQRSSISHILSGRNKPSFDFIEKMLNAYPELDAQWLITGKGNMFVNQPSLFSDKNENKQKELTSRESHIENFPDISSEKTESGSEMNSNEPAKHYNDKKDTDIERIVIFYKNGSFNEYKPG